jgi:hypothetical protein
MADKVEAHLAKWAMAVQLLIEARGNLRPQGDFRFVLVRPSRELTHNLLIRMGETRGLWIAWG